MMCSDNELWITSFVDSIAEKEGFRKYSIEISEQATKGEAYLSKIYFASTDDANKLELSLVVKLSISNKDVRKLFCIPEAFANEIYFYSVVYPTLDTFQRQHGLENIFNEIPKFYGSIVTKDYDIISLENLKKQLFTTFDQRQLFDQNHMKLAIETYAKYHALSFCYRDQHPEEFKMLIKPIKSLAGAFLNGSFYDTAKEIFAKMKDKVEILNNKDMTDKYQKYAEDAAKLFKESKRYDEEHSVLIHQDCWCANMMFKYNQSVHEEKVPTEMRLIDWQIIDLGSPVTDLSYCFFSNGSKSLFDDLERYLKAYHNTLSVTISNLGSDPNKLYPYSKLKEEWNKHSRFGMFLGVLSNLSKLTNQENIVEFSDIAITSSEISYMKNYDEKEFEKRFLDTIRHLYETDLL